MKKILAILTITLLACSPQKRMNRLIRKHPELVQVINTTVKDTFIFRDTIPVPGRNDTLVMTKDTTIYRDNLIFTKKGDTLFFTAKPDTIYVEKPVIREVKVPGRTIVREAKANFPWLGISIILLLLCLLFWLTRKKT